MQVVQKEKSIAEPVKDESEGKESEQPAEEASALVREGDKASNDRDMNHFSSEPESKNDEEFGEKLSEEKKESSVLEDNIQGSVQEKKKEWTVGDIKDEWRKFCLDLSPRVSLLSFVISQLL